MCGVWVYGWVGGCVCVGVPGVSTSEPDDLIRIVRAELHPTVVADIFFLLDDASNKNYPSTCLPLCTDLACVTPYSLAWVLIATIFYLSDYPNSRG